MVFRRSLTKNISRFRMQGPNVSVNSSTTSGPRRVETKVVSRGSVETKTQPIPVRQARGVHSRVTTGMPILNGSLFSEVSTLVLV